MSLVSPLLSRKIYIGTSHYLLHGYSSTVDTVGNCLRLNVELRTGICKMRHYTSYVVIADSHVMYALCEDLTLRFFLTSSSFVETVTVHPLSLLQSVESAS